MKSRTKARSVALQSLYEMDLSSHPPGEIVSNRLLDTKLEDSLGAFTQKIVFGVFHYTSDLDHLIAKHAPEWPLDQVAIIDRNILRIALWELVFEPSMPVKVVINEAIELGKLYGSDATPRFVNGVMGSLVENQNEIKQYFEKRKEPTSE